MANEVFTSSLTSLTRQLTKRNEIELMYYNIKEIANKKHINYTIICDIESVISNLDLLKEIVANMEIIKSLYSKTDIAFNYNIKTLKAFEEDVPYNKESIALAFKNTKMIHSNNEIINNYLEELKDDLWEESKSRH